MEREELIMDLRPTDVLLGRGSGPNDHEGNKRFRLMVAERKAEYMATNHRLTKAKIAQEIVDGVYRVNGRFLRKLEGDEAKTYGIPDGVDAYVAATEATIMEKAKQALRQNASKFKNDGNISPLPFQKQSIQGNNGFDARVIPTKFDNPNFTGSSLPVVPLEDDFEPIPISSTSGFRQAVVPPPVPAFRSDDLEPVPVTIAAPSDMPQWSHQKTIVPSPELQPIHQSSQHQQQPIPVPRERQQEQQGRTSSVRQGSVSPKPIRTVRDTGGNMLDHVAPHAKQQLDTESAGAFGSRRNNAGDESFSNIPIDDFNNRPDDFVNNRRGSITMGELSTFHGRRNYMNQSDDQMMSGLIDSFNQMKTPNDEQKKMFASTETMGTIEPIGMGSMADLSMNSSIFSFYGSSMVGVKQSDVPGDASSGQGAAQEGDQSGGNMYQMMNVPSYQGAGQQQLQQQQLRQQERQLNQQPDQAQSANISGSRFGPTDRGKLSRSGTTFPRNEIIEEGLEGVAGNSDSSGLNYQVSRNPALQEPTPARLMDEQPDDFTIGTVGLSSMSLMKTFVSSNDVEGHLDCKRGSEGH